MEKAKVLNIHNPDLVNIVSNYLLDDKIVAMPCDTIYGFIGKVGTTFNKLEEIKKRKEKRFLELIPSKDISSFSSTIINPKLLDFWPGPLTMIVEKLNGETVAVRNPDNQILLNILNLVKANLYSTSVNISGEQQLNSFYEIFNKFGDCVDLIVEGKDLTSSLASTIIDVTTPTVKLIREGAIPFSEIEKAIL